LELRLIKCSAVDLPRFLALANVIWKPTFSSILTEDRLNYLFDLMYNREKLLMLLNNSENTFFLLRENDADIGYAQLVINSESVKLEKLYLHPDVQGKGYGLYLLNQLINHSLNLGCQNMQLQVNRSNSKAVQFYKKFGFKIIEERDFDVGGGHVMDDFIMSLKLQNR
jgi:ribosomal protein S18 acetylase RimI-like enzyme